LAGSEVPLATERNVFCELGQDAVTRDEQDAITYHSHLTSPILREY